MSKPVITVETSPDKFDGVRVAIDDESLYEGGASIYLTDKRAVEALIRRLQAAIGVRWHTQVFAEGFEAMAPVRIGPDEGEYPAKNEAETTGRVLLGYAHYSELSDPLLGRNGDPLLKQQADPHRFPVYLDLADLPVVIEMIKADQSGRSEEIAEAEESILKRAGLR